MALRRPPTRIELKADDVDEYDKIMKERRAIVEQQALQELSKQTKQISDFDVTPSSSSSTSHKKISAADRIGYRKPTAIKK